MFTKRHLAYTTALAVISLNTSACKTTQPGIEVRTVEVVKEVHAPCPGTPPVRPEPLGELPDNLASALAVTLAKLAEWSAPGQFGDKAEAYVEACPPSE